MAETSESEMISCARCGTEIGRIVTVKGEYLVQVGGLIVAEIAGNCTICGEAFHYSVNARRLERLINRVVGLRHSENENERSCT